MRLNNNKAGIELSKTDKVDLLFALCTLDADQNTRNDKIEDAKSVRAFKTLKRLAYILGVDYDS